MRLITDWQKVALRAYSMWANYLGIGALVTPDVLYLAFGLETSPRFWFWFAMALLLSGSILRLKDQGISRTTQSPVYVAALALVVALGGTFATGKIEVPTAAPSPAAIEQAAPAGQAAFLAEAIPLVARWEGLRTVAYRDPVNIWTVCYGETKGVRPGDSYSEAECAAMLGRRILEYRGGLHRHLTPVTLSARLPVTRDAAYTSFAYNVGIAGAGGSTAVKRLNAGNIAGGCQALTWWNKAGGRVLRGLVARREHERALCLQGLSS